MRNVLILLAAVFHFALQSQPTKNQWFLQGSVGYSPLRLGTTEFLIDEMEVVNDSIRSFTTTHTPDNNVQNGLMFDLNTMYKKRSGWHYILGLQGFIGQRLEFYKIDPQRANKAIQEYGGFATYNLRYTSARQNYVTAKVGVGYETTHARRAAVFGNFNLLLGGAWAERFTAKGLDWYDYEQVKWNYFGTLLKTFGANLDIGTSLKINNDFSIIIKSGVTIGRINSVPRKGKTSPYPFHSNHTADSFSWPKPNNFSNNPNLVNDIFQIVLSAGVRYKL